MPDAGIGGACVIAVTAVVVAVIGFSLGASRNVAIDDYTI
jgi:hypothetical protein